MLADTAESHPVRLGQALIIPDRHTHLLQLRSRIQEMRRDPEHGPALHVAAAEAVGVGQVAALGEARLLELLALAAGRIEALAAGAQHQLGQLATAAVDDQLDAFMHLWALNRGILMTPFHNMALLSPSHTRDDVDHHTAVFAAAVTALTS